MISDVFIGIFLWIINLILALFGGIFDFTAVVTGIDFASHLGKVFGNLMLFDDILPMTESFYLALVALTWKAAILGFDIFIFTISFLGKVKSFFVSWR